MMSGVGRSGGTRFPFTATQWQELEHQALVFKYMVSGMPVPPDLLFTIRRSLDSSLSSSFLIHQPQQFGWNSFNIGFGRKIDPEPGRCRRTDGKKWRCSKEAYPDSKYCERHMHRGRNRSRKPVEVPPPNGVSVNHHQSIITNRSNPPQPSPSSPASSPNYLTSEPHFLSPHFSSSRQPSFPLSSQESSNFFIDSHLHPRKDCRNISYGHVMKAGEIISGLNDVSAKLTLTASSQSQLKHSRYPSDLQKIQSFDDHTIFRKHKHDDDDHRYYNAEREDQPKKVMHHFLDEYPPKDKDSWTNSEDKMSSHRTQLSISIPNSLHDFFMTQKW